MTNSILEDPLFISTRLGNLIPHYLPLEDWTRIQRNALTSGIQQRLPNAILRSDATKMYNCHGLTFANRRAAVQPTSVSDPDSINIETTLMVEGILSDDGYRLIDPSEVEVGDIAVYRDSHEDVIHHTGIVIKVDTPFGQRTNEVLIVMSKWGKNGEFLHTPAEVPPDSYGDQIQYWTERT